MTKTDFNLDVFEKIKVKMFNFKYLIMSKWPPNTGTHFLTLEVLHKNGGKYMYERIQEKSRIPIQKKILYISMNKD